MLDILYVIIISWILVWFIPKVYIKWKLFVPFVAILTLLYPLLKIRSFWYDMMLYDGIIGAIEKGLFLKGFIHVVFVSIPLFVYFLIVKKLENVLKIGECQK